MKVDVFVHVHGGAIWELKVFKHGSKEVKRLYQEGIKEYGKPDGESEVDIFLFKKEVNE